MVPKELGCPQESYAGRRNGLKPVYQLEENCLPGKHFHTFLAMARPPCRADRSPDRTGSLMGGATL